MSDVIKLLPDHIANQIAAGEVVQRPASVVKELIENSLDAGATRINLIAKDGGRTLVQVIDNGSGMSDIDARMSFERHATSKISKADDLFTLHTKGFRGEALASISAIAHVSLKTKTKDAELGTEIINEGSIIASQESVMCSNGTSISVKNLFYNVPARRNFLGKDLTEYRKILEEFLRIVLVHPEIEFSFHHNGDEVYNLTKSNLRQRIVQIYGAKYNERLVPVNEETDIVKITGFVTKPEYTKANRDQSYFFVNNRYFKDRYFNHAILNAYDGLIPSGKFPPYFLYFDVPTKSIDVNVHPTKTEIKFEENQAIYAIIRSSVKQALGQFNIAPTIDFNQDPSFNISAPKKGEPIVVPHIKVDPDFNPFKSTKPSGTSTKGAIASSGFSKIVPQKEDWDNFYGDAKTEENQYEERVEEVTLKSAMNEDLKVESKKPVQINEKYILISIKSGFILVDQYRAHCRILFDQFKSTEKNNEVKMQKLLFPESIDADKTDKTIWKELVEELNQLGFELSFKGDKIEITGVPVDAKDKNPQQIVNEIFEEYKFSEQELEPKAKIAKSMASSLAIRGGNSLNIEEMEYMVDALFATSSPQIAPNGKKIIETFTLEEITKRFN